jgi:hypothetical protein
MSLLNNTPMFIRYYNCGALTSGFSMKRAYNILKPIRFFSIFLEAMEQFFTLMDLWLSISDSGSHPWHSDKVDYHFRRLWTLLSITKLMWFRNTKTGAMFAMTVPHCAL